MGSAIPLNERLVLTVDFEAANGGNVSGSGHYRGYRIERRARIGWSLSKTSPTDSAAMHYRFERTSSNATKLGDISLDYDKHMPMTSGRKSETIIKIKYHGLRR